MNIEYWRSEIDEIDRELLRLLNRRARLAMKVGAIKSAAGLPCCDPERERIVLGKLQAANSGPLDHEAVTRLFRRIILESRRVQESEQNKRREHVNSPKHQPTSRRQQEALMIEGVLL